MVRRTRGLRIESSFKSLFVLTLLHLQLSDAFIPRSTLPRRDMRIRKQLLTSRILSNGNDDYIKQSIEGTEELNYKNSYLLQQESPLPVVASSDKLKLAFITCSSVFMLIKLYSISGAGAWRYYIAGGLCAAISHTVPLPLDVLKTRKQVDPLLDDASLSEAFRKIIQHDGWHVLLDGLGPTTFGYMFEGSIKFGCYEVLKPIIGGFLANHSRFNSPWTAYLLCGLAAGFAASIVLCPMEAIRIRIVSEREYANNGWVDGTRRMVNKEGTGFLGKGLAAMILKQVPYTMTKNVSFDFFAMRFYATLIQVGVPLTPAVKFCVPLFAAACASILSCVSSQPGDMLLSAVNAHGSHTGTRHAFRTILKSDKGVKGFFVGMQTRFLHVGVIVTLQLLMYDFIKRICGIAATGL
ncbi:hypothetical protein MPSEU_001067800 [Mayamaea pseudoterrestris]|nr:hypothetical protein MPSEU_001067800 [Mayamaea pseudoterrestris]